MSIRVIIPVKELADAKTRLAPALDPAARAGLSQAMLERVIAAAAAAHSVDDICLLGPSVAGLTSRLPLLADPGGGLNPALTAGLAQSSQAMRVIVLAADLPQLTGQDVELLAAAPRDTLALAPDRHGTGTNALSLPLPLATGFAFAFGPDSFASHCQEGLRLGLKIAVVTSAGLARDIDVPDDLTDAAGCLLPGWRDRRASGPEFADGNPGPVCINSGPWLAV